MIQQISGLLFKEILRELIRSLPKPKEEPLEVTEIKSTICLITNVFGYTLLVFKDCHGYQVDAIAPNGDRYCYGEIYKSAASAEARGRKWIEELIEEDED